MATAFECASQERINDVDGGTRTYYPSANTQDVCIIVLPSHLGAQGLAAHHCSYRRVTIRSNGHADARATHQDRPLDFPIADGSPHRVSKIWVVT
jgi:hypothetical protein